MNLEQAHQSAEVQLKRALSLIPPQNTHRIHIDIIFDLKPENLN